jgi:hypothetical protein
MARKTGRFMFLHSSRGRVQFTGCRFSNGRVRFDDGGIPQNRVLAGHPSIVPSLRVDQAGGVGLIDPME